MHGGRVCTSAWSWSATTARAGRRKRRLPRRCPIAEIAQRRKGSTASGWPSATSRCTGDRPIRWAPGSRRSPRCRWCWPRPSPRARAACGSAPASASCRSAIRSAPPRKRPPSIRSAKGRLDFGVGRSGFPRAYSGYGVRYDESRERFQESLDMILKAWTQEGFSHAGQVLLGRQSDRRAAALSEAAPADLGGGDDARHVPDGRPHGLLARHRAARLRRARGASGISGRIAPRGVRPATPATATSTSAFPCTSRPPRAQARAEPEESTMRSYRRLAENFASSVGATGTTASEERAERAERLSSLTLRRRAARPGRVRHAGHGRRPAAPAARRSSGLAGVIMESNVGGRIPLDRVLNSDPSLRARKSLRACAERSDRRKPLRRAP